MTYLKLISGPFKNSNFHMEYLLKYSEPMAEFFNTCTPRYLLLLYKISQKHLRKDIIDKMEN